MQWVRIRGKDEVWGRLGGGGGLIKWASLYLLYMSRLSMIISVSKVLNETVVDSD